MLTIKYGTKDISFNHIVNNKLKNAYITVGFYDGVILKSPPIDEEKARELIHKKAFWIIQKLKLVEKIPQGEIKTGSRMLYLGKRYYINIVEDNSIKKAIVAFNHSKFTVKINPNMKNTNKVINDAFEVFTRNKATEKIKPRVKKWCDITNLKPADLKFRKLNKRWGSCASNNEIIINFDAVKLPFTLIDYIVVHELSHIKIKDHSKKFWELVRKFMPDYKELDSRITGMKL